MENNNENGIAKTGKMKEVQGNEEEKERVSSILEQFGLFTMKQQASKQQRT